MLAFIFFYLCILAHLLVRFKRFAVLLSWVIAIQYLMHQCRYFCAFLGLHRFKLSFCRSSAWQKQVSAGWNRFAGRNPTLHLIKWERPEIMTAKFLTSILYCVFEIFLKYSAQRWKNRMPSYQGQKSLIITLVVSAEYVTDGWQTDIGPRQSLTNRATDLCNIHQQRDWHPKSCPSPHGLPRRIWRDVGTIELRKLQKLGSATAPPLWEEAWPTSRNTVLLHACYHTEFGHSRSTAQSIRTEMHQK